MKNTSFPRTLDELEHEVGTLAGEGVRAEIAYDGMEVVVP
jgi:hypothetical protein